MQETNLFYSNRRLNLAHRGASCHAPENTLPAFQLAAEMGADWVELDLHPSKDGEIVIIHDFRVDKTTNGRGFVREKTLFIPFPIDSMFSAYPLCFVLILSMIENF